MYRSLLRAVFSGVVFTLASAQFPPVPDENTPARLTEKEKNLFQARRLFDVESHAETTLIFSSVSSGLLALLFVALFFIARPFVSSVYMRRELTGDVVYKPEAWIRNVLWISSEEAFSAGISLDGCLHILAWTMAARVFFWLLVISPLPICINWFGAGYPCPANMRSDVANSYYIVTDSSDSPYVYCGPGRDHNGNVVSNFVRLSMTGFQCENKLVWGHIVTLWLITFIVIREVRRANRVFTKLRYMWLMRRPKALACSIMAVNVTARTDKEFRAIFERSFPGKVVDAKLVKFCGPLSSTCAELDKVEAKLEEQALLAIDDGSEDRGGDLLTRRARLREKKRSRQDEIFDLCDKETIEAEQEEEAMSPEERNMVHLLAHRAANFATDAVRSFTDDTVFSRVGFATFVDMRSATQAVQTTYATDPTTWRMSVAPEPSDLLWHYMATNRRSTNQQLRYVIIAGTICIFLFWSTVIGVMQQLAEYAIENIFSDKTKVVAIINPWMKTLVLTICLVVLPKVVEYLLVTSGRMVKNVVYLELQSVLVLFNIIFVIYVTSIAEPIKRFLDLSLVGEFDTDSFRFSNTFGTSVPSQFPTLFTFAAKSFFGLSIGLFQLFFYIGVALYFVVLRYPWNYSWTLARKWSRDDRENPLRFLTLTLLVTIGLMIYQVFPLNAVLFLTLCVFGSVAYRYRVLYVDVDLVDSGGLFWSRYEIHVLVVLILVQITAYVVLSSITKIDLWFAVCTIPLPIVSIFFVLRLRGIRWQFLPALEVEELEDEGEIHFPYVQPQLIRDDDESVDDTKV